jgi:hypothetical protein
MFKTARQTCAALLLAISVSLSAPACGARIDPNATPQQQQQQALLAIERGANVVERVGYFVKGLQDAEISFHRLGRIPQATHEVVQGYLKITAEFVLDELKAAKDATKSPLERRNAVMRALKFVDGLQTGLIDKIPDEDVRSKLGIYISFVQTLLTAWQLMAKDFNDFPLNPAVHVEWVGSTRHWSLYDCAARVTWVTE